jgi:DNA-binding transcriptional ArsR family regulator
MNEAVETALDVLGDPVRRRLFERILARPSRAVFLADASEMAEHTIRHHLRMLAAAKLVRLEAGLYLATADVLPELRMYFDRLWFEASVGEAWMVEHFAVSRRMHWKGLMIGAPRADSAA